MSCLVYYLDIKHTLINLLLIDNAFDYVNKVESFSSIQKVSIQYLGALAMYMAASKVKSKRNITDEKASLSEALDRYESEGLQNGKHSFSSGKPHPDLGDVAIFGVLYSGKSAFVLFYHVNVCVQYEVL